MLRIVVTKFPIAKKLEKKHKEEAKADKGTEKEVKEAPHPLVTHVNNILHSIFSNDEVFINIQQIHKSNQLYAHESYSSNNSNVAICQYKEVFRCKRYDYEEFLDAIMEAPLSETLHTRRKLLSRPDGIILFGKLWVVFSTSGQLYPNMKIRLGLIRARPNFYMTSDNPNVSLRNVDCSLYTRIALEDDYHKKRMEMLAYTPVEHHQL